MRLVIWHDLFETKIDCCTSRIGRLHDNVTNFEIIVYRYCSHERTAFFLITWGGGDLGVNISRKVPGRNINRCKSGSFLFFDLPFCSGATVF